MSSFADSTLDKVVAQYLRNCGRPVDMDKLVAVLATEDYTPFLIKESVWRLLEHHEAVLTPDREIEVVRS